MSQKLELHKMLNNAIADVDIDKRMTVIAKVFSDKNLRSNK
jgi:hypothetical protein